MDILLVVAQEVQVLNYENILARMRKEGLNDIGHDKFGRYSFGPETFRNLEEFLEFLKNSQTFRPSFWDIIESYHIYDKWFVGEVVYYSLNEFVSSLIDREEKMHIFEGDLRRLSWIAVNLLERGFESNSIYHVALESFKLLYSLSFVLKHNESHFGRVLTESVDNLEKVLYERREGDFRFHELSKSLGIILGGILERNDIPNLRVLYFPAVSYYILGGESSKESFCSDLENILSNFRILLVRISSRESFQNDEELYQFMASIELFPLNYLILGAGLFNFSLLLSRKIQGRREAKELKETLKALGYLYERVGTLTYEEEQLKKFVNAASRALCKRP